MRRLAAVPSLYMSLSNNGMQAVLNKRYTSVCHDRNLGVTCKIGVLVKHAVSACLASASQSLVCVFESFVSRKMHPVLTSVQFSTGMCYRQSLELEIAAAKLSWMHLMRVCP